MLKVSQIFGSVGIWPHNVSGKNSHYRCPHHWLWEIVLNCVPAWKKALSLCHSAFQERQRDYCGWISACTLASLGLMCCEEENESWSLFCLLSGLGFIWFEALVLHGKADPWRQSCHTANGGPWCWQEPSGKMKISKWHRYIMPANCISEETSVTRDTLE